MESHWLNINRPIAGRVPKTWEYQKSSHFALLLQVSFHTAHCMRANSSTMSSLLPGLRRAAPRLSRDFFICHQCTKQASPLGRLKLPIKSNLSRTIRFNSSSAAFPEGNGFRKATPMNTLSQAISNNAKSETKKQFFPNVTAKPVAYWLLGSAVSVFGIVVFGGLTRLTESGYVHSSQISMQLLTIK